MTYDERQLHENILEFLEDNISKLVKLKVASRPKYKEYDENFMDFLTAESIDDEDRMELYEELTENSYTWLRHKLTKVIKENDKLMENPLVREYVKLMFASYDEPGTSDTEEAQEAHDDIDVSYAHLFESEDSFYISNFVCYFSPHLSEEEEDELEEKAPDELAKMLEDRVYNHVEEWIDDLPHNDLKVLRELVKKGRVETPLTYQDMLIEHLGLVDRTIDRERTELIIYDDIKNAVAPHLDAAIEKKEKNNEGFQECLLMGMLNMVGHIDEIKAREVIKNLLPQSHITFTPEDVDRFFDHSMIVRYHRGGYACQPDGDLWSELTGDTEWEDEIRYDVTPFYPTDIADVIAHGEYPYFKPYRVRFTLQDVLEHFDSQGVKMKESSVRCYIVRDCRRLNADGNTFCLTSSIPESEDHLWRSKYHSSTRSRNCEWKNKMEGEIRHILESTPMQRMLQKDVMKRCRYILEQEGIAYNNFYKIVGTSPWLKTTNIDGKIYLELND